MKPPADIPDPEAALVATGSPEAETPSTPVEPKGGGQDESEPGTDPKPDTGKRNPPILIF